MAGSLWLDSPRVFPHGLLDVSTYGRVLPFSQELGAVPMKAIVHPDQSSQLSTALTTGWLTRARLNLRKYCQTVIIWYERERQRHQLNQLPEDRLHDIGVNRLEALREAQKPFWRP